VTKSGNTTETLVNGAFFIELLKKYKPHKYQEYMVVITDYDSPLYTIAQQERYNLLEIPKLVGGRYSVFSAVGLFPLALVGIPIQELMAGARVILDAYFSGSSDAAVSAALIYTHFKSGKNIHDTFLFSPHLYMLGNWYRQLVGESLGKKLSLEDVLVETGMTPTVSIGTTDLHSVAQLYLGGPRDKFTSFVQVAFEPQVYTVPNEAITTPVSSLVGKTVATIKKAIFEGVEQAYASEHRPFVTITLPERSAYSLGQYMMFKICETISIGHLLGINAFDQPAVELYKEKTRKILSRG
nr:hypothetical protein [Candidatus Dependentiae bacterium]